MTSLTLSQPAGAGNGVPRATKHTHGVIVTNIPSPYQVDLFTELSRQPGLRLSVVFCTKTEKDRSFPTPESLEFEAFFPDSFRPIGAPKDFHFVPGLARLLNTLRPDVGVVSGSYYMPAARSARHWFRRNAVPWVFWGENPNKKSRRGWIQAVKQWLLSRFLNGSQGVLGVGARACDAYRGPSAGRVVNLAYAPDLRPLLAPTPELLKKAREFRSETPSRKVVTFAGSLTRRKAPDLLVQAFQALAGDDSDSQLWLVGSGPLEKELRSQVQQLGLGARVRFAGFLSGDALRAAYLASDVFVLPTSTHEGWGVVVQEALAAGLPVIATRVVGASHDLIVEGVNGWVIPENDLSALTRAMRDALRSNLAPDRVRSTVIDYGSERTAPRFARCLQRVARGGVLEDEPEHGRATP